MTLGGAPLALAFTAGLVATVNPCGFAMLPAYLSYFLGLEGTGPPDAAERSLGRALGVAGMLTSGFVLVFGAMGLVIVQVSGRVQRQLPWVTIVIGLGLVVLGVFGLRGRSLKLRLPGLARVQGGSSRQELSSMFLFGVSYALSSLTCTIGPFLATTGSTFTETGTVAGVATFVTYGLGMGAMVSLLTVALAMARNGLVAHFRRAMRHVERVSGLLMVLAGSYLAYYGIYEVRLRRYGPIEDPVVDRALQVQSWMSGQLEQSRTAIGVLAAVVVGVTSLSLVVRRVRRARTPRTA